MTGLVGKLVAMLPLVMAMLLLSTWAHAETTPLPGAVSFPDGTTLRLPFPAGNAVRILSGYGPVMGSGLHDGTDATSKANDYYALDLVYDDEPNFGKGLPIVASLPGEVVKAGWATAGWANYGLRVIVRHDLGDGHVYYSIYCHLNAIDGAIVEGESVVAGQVLGELGQSCQEMLSCGSFSTPHLHWSLHRDSSVGGSGTGGSYGGNAVVPEPLDGVEDLAQGMVIDSTNTATAECGDGFCNGDEDHDSCPDDCPICQPVPPAGRAIDESELLCFGRHGSAAYWHEEDAGYNDSLIWTTASEGPLDNYGIWQLSFEQAGPYLLEVYTDASIAQSEKAAYQVTHGGATDTFIIDQTIDGWQVVGTLDFEAGDQQHVRLDDVTGEAVADARPLVFDAIRLSSMTTSTTATSAGSGGSTAAGTTGNGGAATTADPGVASADAGDGCSCGVVNTAPGQRAWLLLAAATMLARRRRRTRRRRYSPLCTR